MIQDGVVLFNLTSLLPDQQHRVTLYPYGGPFFVDYVTILPGAGSPAKGDAIIQLNSGREEWLVDDSSSRIRFEGEWRKVTFLPPGGSREVRPFRPVEGSWASTSTNGSSFEFDLGGKPLISFLKAISKKAPERTTSQTSIYSMSQLQREAPPIPRSLRFQANCASRTLSSTGATDQLPSLLPISFCTVVVQKAQQRRDKLDG